LIALFSHFFTAQHGTSCSGESRLEDPPSSRIGDTKNPLESDGKVLSQEDDDNDDESSDDNDEEEEDAELTKKLNKQLQERLQGQGEGHHELQNPEAGMQVVMVEAEHLQRFVLQC
jgi:hypothetical protein